MGAVQVVDAGQVTAPVRTPVRERLGNPVKLVASLLVFAFALVLPGLIDSYWLLVMTSVVIYSIVTLGLGLLIGRVGMIEIFGAQNATGTNPAVLAHGISTALYNTGFGLAIAMPALVFYRHFRALVDSFIIDMELQAVKFVDVVHGARK